MVVVFDSATLHLGPHHNLCSTSTKTREEVVWRNYKHRDTEAQNPVADEECAIYTSGLLTSLYTRLLSIHFLRGCCMYYEAMYVRERARRFKRRCRGVSNKDSLFIFWL